jgi:hypothetical protein
MLNARAQAVLDVARSSAEVSDKFIAHRYQFVYSMMAMHLRDRHVRVLEIGLGCGMYYGPGVSIPFWKKFFGATLELEVLEYDEPCAKKYESAVNKMWIGDQRDKKFLNSVVSGREQHFGPWRISRLQFAPKH